MRSSKMIVRYYIRFSVFLRFNFLIDSGGRKSEQIGGKHSLLPEPLLLMGSHVTCAFGGPRRRRVPLEPAVRVPDWWRRSEEGQGGF